MEEKQKGRTKKNDTEKIYWRNAERKKSNAGTRYKVYLKDGSTVSLQSTMDGVYPFLDTAFAGWCLQTGRDPESCDFHDPSKSLWFPPVEES